MKCANCGRELLPGVKFCAGCGSPVVERTTIPASEIPVNLDTPPIMPEVPVVKKKKTGKIIALIGIAAVMIAVLVLAFFTLTDAKNFLNLSGILPENFIVKIVIFAGAFVTLLIALLLVLLLKKGKKATSGGTYAGSVETLSVSGTSDTPAAPVYEAPVAPAAPAAPVYEAPVAPAASAAPVYEEPVAPVASAAPVYEAPVTPVASAAPVYETPIAASVPIEPVNPTATVYVNPVEGPIAPQPTVAASEVTYESRPAAESVSYIPPTETVAYTPASTPAPAPKSDLDVYNSVDEFEALNAPFAPVEAAPSVSYPTSPSAEPRKTVSDGWFTTAGDL